MQKGCSNTEHGKAHRANQRFDPDPKPISSTFTLLLGSTLGEGNKLTQNPRGIYYAFQMNKYFQILRFEDPHLGSAHEKWSFLLIEIVSSSPRILLKSHGKIPVPSLKDISASPSKYQSNH